MTFARITSLVGTIALCCVGLELRATKIEFSIPTSEVAVPDLQKELKQDAKTEVKRETGFRAGPTTGPMIASPVQITGQERDTFARDKDKERNGRPSQTENNANGNTPTGEQMKAMKAAEQMRSQNDGSLTGSAWQMDRRSGMSADSDRNTDSDFNTRERSVGWSTLFKQAQEERERKEQAARLNEFRALYETPSSISPIGTPGVNTDPLKQSIWHEPGVNPHDGRTELLSRPDEAGYGQQLPGARGSADTFNSSVGGRDFGRSQLEPIKQFDQHRAVLEMPKRPGDLLK